MKRRTFLSSAIAAPLAAPAAGAAARSDGRGITIGFLGGSHSHAAKKVEIAQNSPDFTVAGMWSEDEQTRAQYEKRGIKQVSIDDLLGDPASQVIAVESPVRDHCRHARMVLEAGKHVHIEKAPALDVESFRDVQNLAARKKLIVQMGYMWRHHPGINRMLEAARKGWLGDVYLVQATIHKSLDGDRRPEWAEFRGGQMYELGGHVIDPVIRLLGRPDRVTPFLKKSGKFNDTLADNTIAVFEFPGALGVVVGATLHHNGSPYRSFEVHGTEGTAVMQPIEPPRLEFDMHAAAGPYAKGRHAVELPKYERYVGDLAELAAAVRGEKPIAVTPHEDLIVQEALIAATAM
jgi:predicted dehydrogenase